MISCLNPWGRVASRVKQATILFRVFSLGRVLSEQRPITYPRTCHRWLCPVNRFSVVCKLPKRFSPSGIPSPLPSIPTSSLSSFAGDVSETLSSRCACLCGTAVPFTVRTTPSFYVFDRIDRGQGKVLATFSALQASHAPNMCRGLKTQLKI